MYSIKSNQKEQTQGMYSNNEEKKKKKQVKLLPAGQKSYLTKEKEYTSYPGDHLSHQ